MSNSAPLPEMPAVGLARRIAHRLHLGVFRWRDSGGGDADNLARIDDRTLADLGITRADVDEELRRLD